MTYGIQIFPKCTEILLRHFCSAFTWLLITYNSLFILEPNIQDVVIFDNSERSQRRTLSYSNMQLISREIELEKMRRFEVPKVADTSKKTTTVIENIKEKSKGVTALPNHLQRLQAKSVKTVKPVSDFICFIIIHVQSRLYMKYLNFNMFLWFYGNE